MSPRTASSLSRVTRLLAAAWLAVVLGLIMGLGSCTAVLNLDDYGNVADEMCSLLNRCYSRDETANCLIGLEKSLNQAPLDVRADWLDRFTTFGCLESCSAGRHCLNIPPLCIAQGACGYKRECCGFLEGNADCRDQKCCATRGSPCGGDIECCADLGACVDGVCGGIPCLPSQSPCTTDAQCCTKICKRGACADTICDDDKAGCAEDQDCCSHFCDPASHLCAEPPKCGAVTTACTLNTECCAGTSCLILSGALTGTCQQSTCSFADIDCSADTQCCSGHCESQVFCAAACVHEGTKCAADADCCTGACHSGVCAGACSTTTCNVASDCCSNSCFDHLCGAACEPPSSHLPCSVGGPLDGTPQNPPGCVDLVCAADPYCCCGAWDELCVDAAALQPACPVPCQ
ncbi:MAG: hypothetical protein ABJE95_21730 [Byssovorax sp.]